MMKLDWRQRRSQREQRTRRMKKWRAKDQRGRRQRFRNLRWPEEEWEPYPGIQNKFAAQMNAQPEAPRFLAQSKAGKANAPQSKAEKSNGCI